MTTLERPAITSREEYEAAKVRLRRLVSDSDETTDFRDAIQAVQREIESYENTLALLAGAPGFADDEHAQNLGIG